MFEFISWPFFIATFVIVGGSLILPRQQRYFAISIANFFMCFALLGQSSLTLIAIASINFFSIQRFHTRSGRLLFHSSWILSLLPFLLLRANISFELKNLVLSFSLCFFSLQQVGALIDLYNRRAEPPKDYFHWMSFGIFFPALIAGPIGRWTELRSALLAPHPFEARRAAEAVILCSQGVFKKMVFAIPLLMVADRFFASPVSFGPTAAIVIAIFLRYGLWADISAHTDWSRGISTLLGIDQRPNFDRPFQTTSLVAFWRRWHISLSSWLQDYIFLPLAFGRFGKRLTPKASQVFAALVAFTTLGLWHGLTLPLAIMGFYKGVGVLISVAIEKKVADTTLPKRILGHTIGVVLFCIFVLLPTLLLKISINDMVELLKLGFTALTEGDTRWTASWKTLISDRDGFEFVEIPILMTIGLAIGWEILQYCSSTTPLGNKAQPAWAEGYQWSDKARTVLFILLFGAWLAFAVFSSTLSYSYVQI